MGCPEATRPRQQLSNTNGSHTGIAVTDHMAHLIAIAGGRSYRTRQHGNPYPECRCPAEMRP
eukprot:1942612-Amphidinium_carterae.1